MTKLSISALINKPIKDVWMAFNDPASIVKWNFAHPSWHCPSAENDMQVGGQLRTRMEAVDGSMGFDFVGTYTEIIHHEKIVYALEDGRVVDIRFEDLGDATRITETFDAENQNPPEMQQQGWQAILDNFKNYVEA